jgi:NADPH-dependent curcumin reductase CurA
MFFSFHLFFKFKGEVLEIAIAALNAFGRVINCGAISAYNSETGVEYGINLVRISLRGT